MDMDDAPAKRGLPIEDLEREDLDSYSREDLEDRIARLKCEEKRTQAVLKAKGSSQSVAEALFRKS